VNCRQGGEAVLGRGLIGSEVLGDRDEGIRQLSVGKGLCFVRLLGEVVGL